MTSAVAVPSSSTTRPQRNKRGNSRYAKKVTAPVRRAPAPPVNLYLSVCCKEQATKSRAVTKEKNQVSVGKWRCGKCTKVCKVTVSKAQAVEAVA